MPSSRPLARAASSCAFSSRLFAESSLCLASNVVFQRSEALCFAQNELVLSFAAVAISKRSAREQRDYSEHGLRGRPNAIVFFSFLLQSAALDPTSESGRAATAALERDPDSS